jgi:hypothetical protein
MIDTDKYEGHLANEGQTWRKSKWMLKNAETIEQHKATSALLEDAPLLLEEVKRLRDFIQSVWDGLGEAGRNEHYELFKEYMGDD